MKTTLTLATALATLMLGSWSGNAAAADTCTLPATSAPPRSAGACLDKDGDVSPAGLPAIDVLVTGTKPNTVVTVPASRPIDLAARPTLAGH